MKSTIQSVLICAVLLFINPMANAQFTATPHLLKDINIKPGNSNFSKPIEFNGKLLFSATDWQYGDELWVSDGTANGTSLLKDIYPGFSGSNMSTPVKISTGIVFAAITPTYGYELWISDGTSNGTKLIKDIAPGGKDAISEVKMEVLNNKVFFKANPNDGTGEELWVTDGTANGTQMIKNINSGALSAAITNLYPYNGYVYFGATSIGFGNELWRSDGTEIGTTMVRDIYVGSSGATPTNFVENNNLLYFFADSISLGRELWVTDGTSNNTRRIADIFPGANGPGASLPKSFKSKMYFRANSGVGGFELYVSDGTKSGTKMLKDINPGTTSSSPDLFTEHNGYLYFVANVSGKGQEMWRTDGTDTGTQLFYEFITGTASSNPNNFISTPKGMFFTTRTTAQARELYITNGTSIGTVRLSDFNTKGDGVTTLNALAYFNGSLFIKGIGNNNVDAIYTSDGTALGSKFFKHTNQATADASIDFMGLSSTDFYFSAYTDSLGTEVYKSNGTASGTKIVTDLVAGSGSSNPFNMLEYKGLQFFIGTYVSVNGSRYEIYSTDGTESGTKRLNSANSDTFPYNVTEMVLFNGELYFTAENNQYGSEVWRTDGTYAGTTLVTDIAAGSESSGPREYRVAGDNLFFSAVTLAEGLELYAINKNTKKAKLLKDIFPGADNSDPNSFCAYNNKLYFNAVDKLDNYELWVSDGTDLGTKLFKDISNSSSGYPNQLFVVNNLLVFSASDSNSNFELWRSDGTTNGTYMIREINGTDGSFPQLSAVYNNQLYLSCFSDTFGTELWVTDGTKSGTYIPKEIVVGKDINYTPNFGYFYASKNRMYYMAKDSIYGEEFYSTNGTASGTRLLADIATGTLGSNPYNFTMFNHRLYFTAEYPEFGIEWFYVEPELSLFNKKDVKIINGSTNTGFTDSTSFGDVIRWNPKTQTFILRNVGVDTATITSINITGQSDAFLYKIPVKKSLGELDTTHLKITAAPTIEGLNTATISINWKIGNEPMTFTYNISVNGLPNNKITPISHSNLVLEPNPVLNNSIVTAQLPLNSKTWQLTDLNGRIVQEGVATGAELAFIAPQNGLYIFTVFTLDGKTQSTKILVQ